MDTARIVSNHSAKRAVGVRCRIRSPGQTKWSRRIAQLIANDSWLHARKSLRGIDFQDSIKVSAPINHNGSVAALA
jgi:hypothetical protein